MFSIGENSQKKYFRSVFRRNFLEMKPLTSFERENFDDVRNLNESTLKMILVSSDVWSICRIGDYFLSEKINQPFFRLNFPFSSSFGEKSLLIVEENDRNRNFLRTHHVFNVDWFTDNSLESSFRISPTRIQQKSEDLHWDFNLESYFKLSERHDRFPCFYCRTQTETRIKQALSEAPKILVINFDRKAQRHSFQAKIKFPLRFVVEKTDENSVELSAVRIGHIDSSSRFVRFSNATISFVLICLFNSEDSAKTALSWLL